jgi:hypothetical protein
MVSVPIRRFFFSILPIFSPRQIPPPVPVFFCVNQGAHLMAPPSASDSLIRLRPGRNERCSLICEWPASTFKGCAWAIKGQPNLWHFDEPAGLDWSLKFGVSLEVGAWLLELFHRTLPLEQREARIDALPPSNSNPCKSDTYERINTTEHDLTQFIHPTLSLSLEASRLICVNT